MSQKNWQNDAVQFPRLIAEMEAAGFFTTDVRNQKRLIDLCDSMDLNMPEVMELVDRAQAKWDAIKAKLN